MASTGGVLLVTELTVRPTTKFLKAGAILAALVVVGLEIAFLTIWKDAISSAWVMAAPFVLLLSPLSKWLGWRLTKTTISGDRLRHESGMASKTTRNIQLSKVQDVRVDQSVTQRIFGIGNLSIETAGEASRLVVVNVDSPQQLADEIMNRVQRAERQTQY